MPKSRDEDRFEKDIGTKEIDHQAERPAVHPIDSMGHPVSTREPSPEEEKKNAPRPKD